MNTIRKRTTLWTIVAALLVAAASVSTAATMYDLTSEGTKWQINDAWFCQSDPHSTGTGVINSFLRVQNKGIEQGYNTDYSHFEFDEKGGGFTHSLNRSVVPTVLLDGRRYREFLLDINELDKTPDNLLSLDSLQIFLGNAPNLHGYPSSLGTLIYNLDAANADNWIKLNYNLNSGSGGGDMYAYIPDSLFQGGTNDWVYLYCRFGVQCSADVSPVTPGTDASAGFEEWAIRQVPASPPVPEFGSPVLALMGMLPLVVARVRRRA